MMRSVVIIGGTMALGLALIGLWAMMSRPPESETGPVTYVEDSVEFARDLALDGPSLAVAENFVGDQIHVVSGTVRNTGETPVRSVELRLIFEAYDGRKVHEFTGEALRSALPPGDGRTYEFRFENLPNEWNFGLPSVDVLRLGY